MLEQIEYIENETGVMLCRCYGSGGALELPSCIGGRAVTQLADHVFAGEPSFALRSVPKKVAVLDALGGCWEQSDAGPLPELPQLCAGELEQIVLPGTIRSIGNYAFYGCRALKSISLPGGLRQLGAGAFVACNHLEELRFCCGTDCMKDVLGELSYEIEAVLEDEEGRETCRLLFPEYYEDSVENTPARIIEVRYEGTGYKYRQCFAGREIDFARYDALFYTASVQELPGTVLRLAIDRLLYPRGLGPEAREAYLSWLREHPGQTAQFCLRQESETERILRLLFGCGYFTKERLELFLDRAEGDGDREAVSLLLEYRRTHFRGKRISEKYSF